MGLIFENNLCFSHFHNEPPAPSALSASPAALSTPATTSTERPSNPAAKGQKAQKRKASSAPQTLHAEHPAKKRRLTRNHGLDDFFVDNEDNDEDNDVDIDENPPTKRRKVLPAYDDDDDDEWRDDEEGIEDDEPTQPTAPTSSAQSTLEGSSFNDLGAPDANGGFFERTDLRSRPGQPRPNLARRLEMSLEGKKADTFIFHVYRGTMHIPNLAVRFL